MVFSRRTVNRGGVRAGIRDREGATGAHGARARVDLDADGTVGQAGGGVGQGGQAQPARHALEGEDGALLAPLARDDGHERARDSRAGDDEAVRGGLDEEVRVGRCPSTLDEVDERLVGVVGGRAQGGRAGGVADDAHEQRLERDRRDDGAVDVRLVERGGQADEAAVGQDLRDERRRRAGSPTSRPSSG